jgi:hypothetical protein
MPPTGFEPAIPTNGRPQTHDLNRAASNKKYTILYIKIYNKRSRNYVVDTKPKIVISIS